MFQPACPHGLLEFLADQCSLASMLSICGHETFYCYSEGKGQSSQHLVSGSNNLFENAHLEMTLTQMPKTENDGSTAHWAPAAAARTIASMGDLRRRAGGIADAIALGETKGDGWEKFSWNSRSS